VTSPAIAVTRLHKAYGQVVALDDVTFEVPVGSVLGLLGPNGSGKTTTVSVLSTAMRADAGRATVCGFDVRADGAVVRGLIGFAGQFAAVDANLTGRENLALIGRLSRLPRRGARDRAAVLLDRFGLTDAADRLVRTYSGGMRRRLDVAAALAHQPPVLFLDEPATGLDPDSRFALWDAVRQLVQAGTTVLLTTQYLDEADALADRIVILDRGRVAAEGTPAALKSRTGAVMFTLGFSDEAGAAQAEQALATAGYAPERNGSGIRASSAAGSGSIVGMLRALQGRAPDPDLVAIREPTLDDVFLALTGSAPAAPSGQPAAARRGAR
jgi:ABC-2 type transport system ATP-binding protein